MSHALPAVGGVLMLLGASMGLGALALPLGCAFFVAGLLCRAHQTAHAGPSQRGAP